MRRITEHSALSATVEERTAVLASLFACSDEHVRGIEGIFFPQLYQRDDVIVGQEDEAAHIWFVVEGSAQARTLSIEGQYSLIANYGVGELFGAFPEPSPSHAEIAANERLLTLRVSTVALAEAVRRSPAVSMGLSLIFAAQLDAMLARLAARITLSATGRVCAEIARMAGETRTIVPAPVVVALAIRAQTTRETASRAINALERRGIIARGGGKLEVLAPRALAELIA